MIRKIEELYKVTYTKTDFYEDDFGGTYGKDSQGTTIEFNYNDAIETYVSFCEDGYRCNYERIDEGLSNSIRALDGLLGITIHSIVNAYDRNDVKAIKDLRREISILELAIQTVFNSADIQVYDVSKRHEMFLEHYENKLYKKAK